MYIRRRRGRRARLLFLLFAALAIYYWNLYEAKRFEPVKVYQVKPPEKIEEKKFLGKKPLERTGETIVYDIILGKMRLGEAVYRHVRETELNGHPVYLITFETKAVRFRDLETIYCDKESFLPLIIERKVTRLIKPEKIREVYDQQKYILSITKKRFTEENLTIVKKKPIQNSILLPYVVRNNSHFEIGWSFVANLPQREYKIILAAIETIEIPAGKFQAYYFESQPKQIKIWISADERRIPLKIEGTGSLGYKLVMQEYKAPVPEGG